MRWYGLSLCLSCLGWVLLKDHPNVAMLLAYFSGMTCYEAAR